MGEKGKLLLLIFISGLNKDTEPVATKLVVQKDEFSKMNIDKDMPLTTLFGASPFLQMTTKLLICV